MNEQLPNVLRIAATGTGRSESDKILFNTAAFEIERLLQEVKRERCFKETYLKSLNTVFEANIKSHETANSLLNETIAKYKERNKDV